MDCISRAKNPQFLSRDGWDTCASIENWSSRLGSRVRGETHDWWGADRRKWTLLVDQIIPEHPDLAPHACALREMTDHRAMAATEWIVTMREGLRVLQEYPDDVLHVPYSALCAAPERVCARIAEFTGLAPDPVFIRYAAATLSPPRPKAAFALPDMLDTAFRETCEALRDKEFSC